MVIPLLANQDLKPMLIESRKKETQRESVTNRATERVQGSELLQGPRSHKS